MDSPRFKPAGFFDSVLLAIMFVTIAIILSPFIMAAKLYGKYRSGGSG